MDCGAMRLQLAMTPTTRQLSGRRIVVTRAREQAGDLVRTLEALGADVVLAPAIRIEPLDAEALAPLEAAVRDLGRYRWIVFTSQNTVRIVCDQMHAWGRAPGDLGSVPVAAIGPATAAALEAHGVTAQVVPPRFVAEAVVDALRARGGLEGARVLLPRAQEARDALPEGLRALGAEVDVMPVYRTVAAPGRGGQLTDALRAGTIDAVTFTSSSTVRHFVELVGGAATTAPYTAAVIGPITAATARELGLPVRIEASEYTVPGLVSALVEYFA
jgi:uroporphyrinogen III methyltransferase/synthase